MWGRVSEKRRMSFPFVARDVSAMYFSVQSSNSSFALSIRYVQSLEKCAVYNQAFHCVQYVHGSLQAL